MTRKRMVLLAVVFVVLLGAGAVIWSRMHGAGDQEADAAPIATVTVAPIERQRLQTIVTAYGVVQSDPAASFTLAAPRAVIVAEVLVAPGQSVSRGQPLIEVANAPASAQAYADAVNAAKAARDDLARVQRLYDQHLAASDQLIAAQKAQADAQTAVAAQLRQGAGQAVQTLRAAASAIVISIPVAAGDHATQDAPLLVLARQGALVVKLGLEPTDGPFQVGQAVILRPVAGGAAIPSHLAMVGHTTDPATKTIDATAPLNGAAVPVGAGVQGDVVTGETEGLTVPKASVVYDETGTHLFVISGGTARRVFVTAGADHDDRIAVTGPLAPGEMVAVQGAYELEDGMAVKVAGR